MSSHVQQATLLDCKISFFPAPPSSIKRRSTLPLSPSSSTPSSVSLLELCSDHRELRQILSHVIKNGLFFDHVVQTKLIGLFCRFRRFREASSLLFDSVEAKDEELYHCILKGHAFDSSSTTRDVLSFFAYMKRAQVRPIVHNFTYMLKCCGDNSDSRAGMAVHSQLISAGFASNTFAATAVVNMYSKCRMILEARKMFDEMSHRDLVAWNAMIAGYSQNGMPEVVVELVRRLQEEEGMVPDSITLVSILPALADMNMLKVGRSVHGYAMRSGFESLVNVSTALIDMYAKAGRVRSARSIFDRMKSRNVVSWNSMIDGYGQCGDAHEAIRLFRRMREEEEAIKPTEVTLMGVLHACGEAGDVEAARFVHDFALEVGLESNSVANAMITMYSKLGMVDVAAEVFNRMPDKTRISWNAMILGYAQNGRKEEAMALFREMLRRGVDPDSFTLVSVIEAVAEASILRRAKWIHGYTVRRRLDRNVFVATALVDMYVKCGGVRAARRIFEAMGEKHVTTWNAMIDGYGTHGLGQQAVELFEEMKKASHTVRPNEITFLSVVSACSHSGMVDEGKSYFESMKRDYGFVPTMDHYGCVVDLLGRAGKLDEAWEFILQMPVDPSISVYGAILGACKIHKNVDLAAAAAARIFDLGPDQGGYHVLLANIYANASMWKEVAGVRRSMEARGLHKMPGRSDVELEDGQVHAFYSGATNHPQSEKIYAKLETLIEEMKAIGYVPEKNSIHDVEEEVQEKLISSHSEKLAIAFGLISTKAGTTIQIRKNLRFCDDCHNATKYISQLSGREIVVRDTQRFHHFKDGACSCRDYW